MDRKAGYRMAARPSLSRSDGVEYVEVSVG